MHGATIVPQGRLVSMNGHNETKQGRGKEWEGGRKNGREGGRGRKGEERESTNLLCTNGNVAPSLQCPHKYVSIHVRSRNCETINTRTKSHVISARSLLSNNFCCKSYKIPNLHKVCNAHFTHYKSESPHSTVIISCGCGKKELSCMCMAHEDISKILRSLHIPSM